MLSEAKLKTEICEANRRSFSRGTTESFINSNLIVVIMKLYHGTNIDNAVKIADAEAILSATALTKRWLDGLDQDNYKSVLKKAGCQRDDSESEIVLKALTRILRLPYNDDPTKLYFAGDFNYAASRAEGVVLGVDINDRNARFLTTPELYYVREQVTLDNLRELCIVQGIGASEQERLRSAFAKYNPILREYKSECLEQFKFV